MKIHKILENPAVYDTCQKILSFIAAGNKGMGNFLEETLGSGTGSILDIGCGTGRFAKIFGGRYTGIDNNPQYIACAKKYAPEGNFFVADSSDVGFLNRQFDYVLSICTFHHLSDEQVKKTVARMKEMANKKIFIIDPVYPPLFNILGYLLFKLDRGQYRRTFDQLNKLLEPAGFKPLVLRLKQSFPYRICVFEFQK